MSQKMCRAPRSQQQPQPPQQQQQQQEKIDYEHLSTNCTVVGSNNLNLVKKGMSPAYANQSPGGAYPPSPYSVAAAGGLKSPPPGVKPPTPQPAGFPLMQIIHNANLIGRPMQAAQAQPQPPQNVIKLKPHLNILPKPAASPQPSPKPSVSPQIVIPTTPTQQAAAIVPAQPLLLNQVPMLAAPGVQFVLRPPATATQKISQAPPPGLVLQAGAQPLLHLQQGGQPVAVRVLANGVQLAGGGTYVTQMAHNQPINAAQIQQQIVNAPPHHQPQHLQAHQPQVQKKKPKHKPKKKLDLANIMKLSGIGDEDDIQFESDTSQSESEHNSVPTTPQPAQPGNIQTNFVHTDAKKNIQNIQISAMAQPTINTTPVVQVLNQNFQSGMISNSTSQAAATAQSLPFNSFIAPNFTINNGLMLQRTGGFKLTVGEDGRLMLQHDPTINQDLQSQLILQTLLGLNGGLVLQPSMDQQTVQQTVQTIQQQSVQTIQQQTVQSQTIQTVQQQTVQPQVQHIQSLQPQIQQQTVQQTIQHQTVNALQQPMQIVQPQPIHPQVQHSISQSQVHSLQSQIQGQLQSLLQQQNAVQTQTVHSHMQPQSLPQSIAQNVQNMQSIAQNVQSIAQSVQTVQPPPITSPVHSVHSVHGFQQAHTQTTQPVLKVQPFQQKTQPPVQTVQPIQQLQQQHSHNENQNSSSPTSYVVNLTPEQLEQLKRNGQLTVNGQTIFMQRPNKESSEKKLSPKVKPVKKIQKIQSIKSLLQDNVNDSVKTINNTEQIKTVTKSPLNKHILPHNHVQPIQSKAVQPQAMVQPQAKLERQKSPISPTKQQKVSPMSQQTQDSNGTNTNSDVDKLLGQILEESAGNSNNNDNKPQQKITTIQLTPQKQQHLKNIQHQIHSLSAAARLQPSDQEIQNALKLLFSEQQKILASGKLLPPDKVYYHNNQLTIVNPSGLNLPSPGQQKTEASPSRNSEQQPPAPAPPPQQQQQRAPNSASLQPITTQAHTAPRVSVSVATSTGEHGTQTTIHHHPTHQQLQQHHHNHPNHVVATQRATVSQQTQAQSPPNKQPIVAAQPPQAGTQPHDNQPQAKPIPPPPPHQPQSLLSLAKKAHLIETQLNLDQKGAVKPDVHTPFRDKKDACIRLVRYHCMDQPKLSQKDLDKADEIFELTARHFIGKFGKMVDKYKYLLMKESMRQVQTSELMMLDRMFLADEQQSLHRLRCDYEAELLSASAPAEPQPQAAACDPAPQPPPDDYDEWACIQRELGCLPEGGGAQAAAQPPANLKRASAGGADSRLETLKRFRVEKHAKKEAAENDSIDEQVQSAIDSILNLQQNTNLDLDSILS